MSITPFLDGERFDLEGERVLRLAFEMVHLRTCQPGTRDARCLGDRAWERLNRPSARSRLSVPTPSECLHSGLACCLIAVRGRPVSL